MTYDPLISRLAKDSDKIAALQAQIARLTAKRDKARARQKDVWNEAIEAVRVNVLAKVNSLCGKAAMATDTHDDASDVVYRALAIVLTDEASAIAKLKR